MAFYRDSDEVPAAASAASAEVAAASSGVTPAAAKPPRACPLRVPVSQRMREAAASERGLDIGVFGDSYGEGFWAGLYNDLRDEPKFHVHRFSKQSTGFTRYASLNLQDDARGKLDGQNVDLAVVSYGANDTQDIWAEGHLMPYMSADWKRVVGERVEAYVDQLRDRGAAVVWVGLPRMRKTSFDAQIQQMNAFYEELMCSLNVPFIATAGKSVDEKGGYTDYLRPADGEKPIKVRAGDGIHMSMTGYRILISDMTRDIRSLVRKAPPRAADAQAPDTEDKAGNRL